MFTVHIYQRWVVAETVTEAPAVIMVVLSIHNHGSQKI